MIYKLKINKKIEEEETKKRKADEKLMPKEVKKVGKGLNFISLYLLFNLSFK